MTKLLVSVRSASEAREALAGGAEIIDVKEPSRGSLGAASSSTWQAVRQALDSGDAPLSAALGELVDYRSQPLGVDLAGFSYAKVGLARCGSAPNWRTLWDDWRRELPATVFPVAVIYGDYRAADAPRPQQVIAAAAEVGTRMILIDTFDKSRGGIFSQLSLAELMDMIRSAKERQLQIALAGSLTLDCLELALRCEPDIVAVRGAVCRGGRAAVLDQTLVKHFAQRLSTPSMATNRRACVREIDALVEQA